MEGRGKSGGGLPTAVGIRILRSSSRQAGSAPAASSASRGKSSASAVEMVKLTQEIVDKFQSHRGPIGVGYLAKLLTLGRSTLQETTVFMNISSAAFVTSFTPRPGRDSLPHTIDVITVTEDQCQGHGVTVVTHALESLRSAEEGKVLALGHIVAGCHMGRVFKKSCKALGLRCIITSDAYTITNPPRK
jgi:hypothetical protein